MWLDLFILQTGSMAAQRYSVNMPALLMFSRSMYIFGGFSSVLLSDVLVYKPPDCRAFQDEELCRNAGPGIKCVWNKNHCESWETGNANTILRAKCPPKTGEAFPSSWFKSFSTYLKVELILLILGSLF